MSPARERGGRSPNCGSGATSLGPKLGKLFRTAKKALAPGKEYSQLPRFQTKPECYRKQGPCGNIYEALDRLRTAISSALQPGFSKLLTSITLRRCQGLTLAEARGNARVLPRSRAIRRGAVGHAVPGQAPEF